MGYDYRQPGAYFVTICTHRWEPLFGEVINGEVQLNEFGEIVAQEWYRTREIRHEIELDAFVVMPNHIHGIIMIQDNVGAHGRAPLRRPARSLGSLIAGYKSAVTKRINISRHTPGQPVWQRNYYEHVIRNDTDLNRIRVYIHFNPAGWQLDKYHSIANRPTGFNRLTT